jgi:hypothetical protein
MKGKSFALGELLNVTIFVKKQLRMQARAVREENGPAKRYRSDCRLSEKPAANSQRQATPPVPELVQLRPLKSELVGEANSLTENSVSYLRDISQVSPPA